MTSTRSVLALLAIVSGLLAATPAQADRVWLKNGNYLEGEARELPDGQVAIVSTGGTLTIGGGSVARIERAETIEQRVQAYFKQNPEATADALHALSRDCRDAGAETLARRVLERALAADPDHEATRQALGYRRHEDRWVTEKELHELRGEVWYRGQWMTADMQAQILYLETQRDAARAERQAEQARDAAIEEERLAQAELTSSSSYGIPLDYLYPAYGAPIYPPGIIVSPPFPHRPGRPPGFHPVRPRPMPQQPAPRPRVHRNGIQRVAPRY